MTRDYDSKPDYLKSLPPRLEDAGLEDTALSVECIQEAFNRAAEVVRSDAGPVHDLRRTGADWSDGVDGPDLVGDLLSVERVRTNNGGLIQPGQDIAGASIGDSEVTANEMEHVPERCQKPERAVLANHHGAAREFVEEGSVSLQREQYEDQS